MLSKIKYYLDGKNRYTAVTLMGIGDIVFSVVISVIFNFFLGEEVFEIDSLKEASLTVIFLATVILAPLIETFIFQFLIIEGTLRVLKKSSFKKYIAAVLSALLFGLTHYYNIYYIGYAFLSGIIFAGIYFYAKGRKGLNPYWVVVSIHAVGNLVAFILDDLLGY